MIDAELLSGYLELVPPQKPNDIAIECRDDMRYKYAAKLAMNRLERDEFFEQCAQLMDMCLGEIKVEPKDTHHIRIFYLNILHQVGYYTKLK